MMYLFVFAAYFDISISVNNEKNVTERNWRMLYQNVRVCVCVCVCAHVLVLVLVS